MGERFDGCVGNRSVFTEDDAGLFSGDLGEHLGVGASVLTAVGDDQSAGIRGLLPEFGQRIVCDLEDAAHPSGTGFERCIQHR